MMSKTFIKHHIPECEQINLPTGRVYRTVNGDVYPSVTSVLGSIPNPYLAEWKAKVGEAEADKIGRNAARLGTVLHQACEDTLHGKQPVFGMFDGQAKEMYKNFLPVFDRIDNIHGIELRMWSDKAKVAGTTDLIAELDGKITVMDWKSSRTYKSASEIDGYFMQGAIYALMFFERTGIVISDICIFLSSPEFGLMEHHGKVREWLPKFKEIRDQFTFIAPVL